MVFRLRVIITRIQTMRSSTMVATFIMIGLLIIYHIKQADYEKRVEKRNAERSAQEAADVAMDLRNAGNNTYMNGTRNSTPSTSTTSDSSLEAGDQDSDKGVRGGGDNIEEYDERNKLDDEDDVADDDDDNDDDDRVQNSPDITNDESLAAEEVAGVNDELEDRFQDTDDIVDTPDDDYDDSKTNGEVEDMDELRNGDDENNQDINQTIESNAISAEDPRDRNDNDDNDVSAEDPRDRNDNDDDDVDDDDGDVDKMMLINEAPGVNEEQNQFVNEMEMEADDEDNAMVGVGDNRGPPSRSLQYFKDDRKYNHESDYNFINEQVQQLAHKYPDTLNDIGIKTQNDLYVERLRYKLYQTGRLDVVDWNRCTKRLPTSIIIGVMKTGTEAFSTFLGLHPQIAMQYGYTGMEFFSNPELYRLGLEWYRERMMCSHRDQVTMEKSPQYFSSAMAPSRIYNMDRDIKLILLVRDPISRAVSHFLQQQNSHPERLPASTFEDSVYDRNRKLVIGTSQYVYQSTYSIIYQRWRKYFPAKNILIVDGDKFKKNPLHGLAQTERFLGLKHLLDESKLQYNKEKGFYCIKTNPNKPVDLETSCLNGGKGRPHPEIDPEVEIALRRYFKPYNDEFMRLTGMHFEW